ncbi:CbtA family protein [Gluconacetobacter entanii]|uniref:CbtA family protein n=1 Tax=Gluconacetobacter entanii TaxID=108528 RepID=A0ABT3K601_9PROT|nr:CbtA family protein [Gluconacetobacter entanii]MBY4640386.1 CbtA family protein [Gluconacetobacter entanii]MCW4581518.1 CbtA family protein [Gluconacetobacter entanii]MCW4584898.1 CbtA family protein [Gluconacetobacter entanii]MCW4588311.1 CbtA family protein [Gluconacetobacter entanii]MCW4590851.1 CbtA family protein [Gluconacetobacter entanii]
MAGRVLLRGMLAGILAAFLAFGFARVVGEPQVDRAIAIEAAHDAAAGEPPEEELVSRRVQSTLGLLTAAVMYGAAYGGVFALAFAVAHGRVGRVSPRMLALLLAGAGFVAVVLVPDLKYPANPPAVGHAETIGMRTAAYFEMVVFSLCAMILSVLAGRSLLARMDAWSAWLCGGALFIVLVTVLQLTLPDISEVPADFPAALLWRFREGALGMQVVLWGALGLVFGALVNRMPELRGRA